MASFRFNGLEELMLSIQEIVEIPEAVKDEILNAQADVLVEEIKERARAYGVYDTGKTVLSIKKGKPRSRQGSRYIVVKPYGTRKRGKKRDKKKADGAQTAGVRKRGEGRVSNAQIAFFQNYGTRKQEARPFYSDAVKMSSSSMTRAAEEVYDKFLKSKNL